MCVCVCVLCARTSKDSVVLHVGLIVLVILLLGPVGAALKGSVINEAYLEVEISFQFLHVLYITMLLRRMTGSLKSFGLQFTLAFSMKDPEMWGEI